MNLNAKTSHDVTGIMLRTSGNQVIVEAEIDGKWWEVIRDINEGPISHIVEPAGMLRKRSELQSD